MFQIKINCISPILNDFKESQNIEKMNLLESKSKYRYFSGHISFVGNSLRKFSLNEEVLVFVPLNYDYSFDQKLNQIMVEDCCIIKKPLKLGSIEAISVVSQACIIYNSLFQKGCFQQGETVLILNAASSYGYLMCQIAELHHAKLVALVNTSDEYNFLKKINIKGQIIVKSDDFTQIVKEDTGGIGIDIIIDFGCKHQYSEIQQLTDLLAPSARWVIHDDDIQLGKRLLEILKSLKINAQK